MTVGPLLWGVWLLTVGATFAYFEARAVHDPKVGDTLTEAVRGWFHTREKTPAGRLGRVLFLALFTAAPAWWLLHILFPGLV
jgi:hypothetical protein